MPDEKRGPQLLMGIGAVILLGVVVALAWVMLQGDPTRMPEPGPLQLGPETVEQQPSAATVQTADSGGLRGRQTQSGFPGDEAASTVAVSFNDESLTFEAVLPVTGAGDPVVQYLTRDTETYLKRMKPAARAEWDAARAAGRTGHPWEVSIEWTYTARAGTLVSLAGRANEYTGGAHPVEFYDAHIASIADGEEIELADMLIPGKSPSPAITVGICEALKAAKLERIGEATIMGAPIVCAGPQVNIKTEAAAIALAPSTLPDRFGGLLVYYGPYDVGPYVEGPYRLTVQQAVFREDLRAQYRPLFEGEAVAAAN